MRYINKFIKILLIALMVIAPLHTPNASAATTIVEYSVTGRPYDITSGPDGNLWFTTDISPTISKITPSGSLTSYSLSAYAQTPKSVITGPDGNLWFTMTANTGAIGKITTTGIKTIYVLPTGHSPVGTPNGLSVGSDGALWYTAYSQNKIGRITTSGDTTSFSIPSGTTQNPKGITTGGDGQLWFTEYAEGKIGAYTP